MNRHQVGDIVWLHGNGWVSHPLIVVKIIGDYEHIEVFWSKNPSFQMTFSPSSLHTHPQEQPCK